MTEKTWLDVQPGRGGATWNVFRVEGIGGDAEQVAGPFRTKTLAMEAARTIAAATGEQIGNPAMPRP